MIGSSQSPDHKAGAYYVSVRSGGRTILALGPFASHRRALGLVTATRMRVSRADLDPWAEFGYGTCRLPISRANPLGAFNAAMGVGSCPSAVHSGRVRGVSPAVAARLAA